MKKDNGLQSKKHVVNAKLKLLSWVFKKKMPFLGHFFVVKNRELFILYCMVCKMVRIIIAIIVLFLSVSSYSMDYVAVDNRAKEVPHEFENNLARLVRYLIEPYKDNDVLKARVIYAWIVYHVEYDAFKYDVILDNISVVVEDQRVGSGVGATVGSVVGNCVGSGN